MSDTAIVTTRIDGDVAVVTLDDGKANAISFAALDQINAALDSALETSKAVAFIGREGKFSAGFDLKVMTGEPECAREMLGRGAELGIRMAEFPIPLVLGVTGHALAMGGIMTVTADYRVGGEGPFKLGLNEVAIGMPVPKFAVELCRARLQSSHFTRALQHAETFAPDPAVAAGFLDEVVELAQVESRAVEVAAHLAATLNPRAFALTRRFMRGAMIEQIRAGLAEDLALFTVET